MKRFSTLLLLQLAYAAAFAQFLNWENADSSYAPLPRGVNTFLTSSNLDGKPFKAFYVSVDLNRKDLEVEVDTSHQRRLTPQQFFEKNQSPLIVVNGSFFSFQTNQNLNTIIRNKKLVGFDQHKRALRGKDTLTFVKYLTSAFGIDKKGRPDIAWVYTDSSLKWPVAFQQNPMSFRDSINYVSKYFFAPQLRYFPAVERKMGIDEAWKMRHAMGGGPVLIHDGKIRITNNEEHRFAGKAINDKHPRTAIGYTKDNKMIILLVEGRNAEASGATLKELAQIMLDLNCYEAMNLDGGGSSCMLINGKETIRPSDKVQRAVPAVLLVKVKD